MMPSERTTKPVASPWPPAVSDTTLTTAGSTLSTTSTTASRPVATVAWLEGNTAWGSAVSGVDPVVHAANASAATVPNARRERLMVMAPVCRVQGAFDTHHPHVHG